MTNWFLPIELNFLKEFHFLQVVPKKIPQVWHCFLIHALCRQGIYHKGDVEAGFFVS